MDLWLKIDRPQNIEADIPLKDDAPEEIKDRYIESNWGDLIVWANKEDGKFGCIRYNRSIAMPLTEIDSIELQEMKPGKGPGYVHLSFVSGGGKTLGGIYSSVFSRGSLEWLSKIQPLIADSLNIEQAISDHGYDA